MSTLQELLKAKEEVISELLNEMDAIVECLNIDGSGQPISEHVEEAMDTLEALRERALTRIEVEALGQCVCSLPPNLVESITRKFALVLND